MDISPDETVKCKKRRTFAILINDDRFASVRGCVTTDYGEIVISSKDLPLGAGGSASIPVIFFDTDSANLGPNARTYTVRIQKTVKPVRCRLVPMPISTAPDPH